MITGALENEKSRRANILGSFDERKEISMVEIRKNLERLLSNDEKKIKKGFSFFINNKNRIDCEIFDSIIVNIPMLSSSAHDICEIADIISLSEEFALMAFEKGYITFFLEKIRYFKEKMNPESIACIKVFEAVLKNHLIEEVMFLDIPNALITLIESLTNVALEDCQTILFQQFVLDTLFFFRSLFNYSNSLNLELVFQYKLIMETMISSTSFPNGYELVLKRQYYDTLSNLFRNIDLNVVDNEKIKGFITEMLNIIHSDLDPFVVYNALGSIVAMSGRDDYVCELIIESGFYQVIDSCRFNEDPQAEIRICQILSNFSACNSELIINTLMESQYLYNTIVNVQKKQFATMKIIITTICQVIISFTNISSRIYDIADHFIPVIIELLEDKDELFIKRSIKALSLMLTIEEENAIREYRDNILLGLFIKHDLPQKLTVLIDDCFDNELISSCELLLSEMEQINVANYHNV